MACDLAGVSCWPPESVEVFDISSPEAPVHVTDLAFAEAKQLFGELVGRCLLVRESSGFQVIGEVTP